MAADKKYHSDGPSAADRALERFTELMIEKIQSFQGNWKKPWFMPGAAIPPQNLSGRHYNGGNSLMLMLQAEKMGYDIPVWGTFDRITNLNYIKDKNGNVFQARDKNGNKLPMVAVNKGEKSFPVFLTTFTVVNPQTKERIPYDDYRNLSKEEQAKYKVYPKLQVFNVFNVAAQTNLELTRPEMYEKLKAQAAGQVRKRDYDYFSLVLCYESIYPCSNFLSSDSFSTRSCSMAILFRRTALSARGSPSFMSSAFMLSRLTRTISSLSEASSRILPLALGFSSLHILEVFPNRATLRTSASLA